MDSAPVIRPFRDGDLPGAVSALIEVYETDGYPVEGVDEPEEWILSAGVKSSWVAVSNDRVIGHVSVMDASSEASAELWERIRGEDASRVATLARLFVVPEARRKALGERLTRKAMEYAREKSLRLVLDVMLKDEAAIRLYERLGWRLIGEAAHHHGAGQSTPAACYVWPSQYP